MDPKTDRETLRKETVEEFFKSFSSFFVMLLDFERDYEKQEDLPEYKKGVKTPVIKNLVSSYYTFKNKIDKFERKFGVSLLDKNELGNQILVRLTPKGIEDCCVEK